MDRHSDHEPTEVARGFEAFTDFMQLILGRFESVGKTLRFMDDANKESKITAPSAVGPGRFVHHGFHGFRG